MHYVAFLRGVGPGDPRMSNDSLRGFFEELGFKNVQTLISSGNVLFESDEESAKTLEADIEKALPERLGFSRAVFIRSREDLQAVVDSRPFGEMEHSPRTNLNVTFLKRPTRAPWKFPHRGEGYTILGMHDRAVFSVVDTQANKTPDLMRQFDKAFGKENTTRTWLTVQRTLKKFGD